MIAYKVFDDEWEDLFGPKQLIDFATDQLSELDDYDLSGVSDEFRNTIKEHKELSFDDAVMVLKLRQYDIEEIELY